MPFLKQSVFARNGALNFWIEYTIYFVYMILVIYYIFKAVTPLEREHQAGTLILKGDYPIYHVQPRA